MSERLVALIEPVAESLGYELLLLEFAPQSGHALLRLYIDFLDQRDQPIGLEDCESVSREVAALLDVEDPIKTAYQLEVSSPGFDRPLTKPAHFRRFAGQSAKLQLLAPVAGRRKFSGRIIDCNDHTLTLALPDGETSLELSQIERARLVPDYSAARSKRKA
ncbi:MAG TPA: ribosome maturation factor RimP [Nevskiaceae bacterium]|nr:ribosome maturation factor RimP [Nevskiaceae bacterium]